MGARGIFFREGPIVDFLGWTKNVFAGVGKSGKITFSPLETRKTTSFCKNWWENVKFENPGAALASTSEAHASETSYDKKAEEDNKNIFTNKHAMIFAKWYSIIFVLIFEPDMKSIEHKHALPAQHRLIITDAEHFALALVVGPQEYRYLFAYLLHFVQHYVTETFST